MYVFNGNRRGGGGEEETRKENQHQISKQNLKTNLSKFRSVHLGGSFSCSLPYGKYRTLTSEVVSHQELVWNISRAVFNQNKLRFYFFFKVSLFRFPNFSSRDYFWLSEMERQQARLSIKRKLNPAVFLTLFFLWSDCSVLWNSRVGFHSGASCTLVLLNVPW